MGAAKTRLARDIGPVHAQRLYRAMTARVLRQVGDPRWDTVIYTSGDPATVPEWRHYAQRPQPDGSLTPRLQRVFGEGPRRAVVVIGTDCPQVKARDVGDALDALRRAPFVFGPASDGGFWLMAARAPLGPGVFDGVRWSSPHTLADMRARVGAVALLRELTDVDDAAGLAAWQVGA